MKKPIKPLMILVCSGIPFLLMHMGVLKSFMHFLGIANGTPCKRVLQYSVGFFRKQITHTQGSFTTILHPYSQWLILFGALLLLRFFVKRTRHTPHLWILWSSFSAFLYILFVFITQWGTYFNYNSGPQITATPWCYYGVWLVAVGIGGMIVNFERDMDKEIAIEEERKTRGGGLSGY